VPFIGPGQINQNGEILASDKFLSEPCVLESTESMPGDILTVCIGGSIGKSAITKSRITFNQQINAISPILVGSLYLYFAMCSEQFKKSILSSSSGSATPIINRSKWENLPVPIPPSNEQLRVVQMIDLLFDICTKYSKKMDETKQIQAVLAEALVEQVVA
jgi:type I restriction enzyme S subunit